MKKWWPLAAFLTILSVFLLWQYQKYRVAPTVDVFSLPYTDTAGKAVDLKAYKGQKIIFSFFGTWCGECVLELKQLNEAKKKDLTDVQVIVVSDEDPETLLRFVRRKQYPFLFLNTSKPFSDLGINAIPVNYLINPKGEVTYSKVGGLNWKDHSVISMAEGNLQ